MERLTEYHSGIAMIKNKTKHREAIEKLAKIEDMENLTETVCDQYCKWPSMGS